MILPGSKFYNCPQALALEQLLIRPIPLHISKTRVDPFRPFLSKTQSKSSMACVMVKVHVTLYHVELNYIMKDKL